MSLRPDIRAAWRTAFRAYRSAMRDCMAPGACERACDATSIMRALSGNWDIPRRFVSEAEHAHKPGRPREYTGILRFHGPYLSGRAFLRRT